MEQLMENGMETDAMQGVGYGVSVFRSLGLEWLMRIPQE